MPRSKKLPITLTEQDHEFANKCRLYTQYFKETLFEAGTLHSVSVIRYKEIMELSTAVYCYIGDPNMLLTHSKVRSSNYGIFNMGEFDDFFEEACAIVHNLSTTNRIAAIVVKTVEEYNLNDGEQNE